MHPSDLYHLSVKLFNDQKEQKLDCQSYARTIINRAYYAAFLAARKVTGKYSSANAHAVVIQALTNMPKHSMLGNKLEDMRKRRVSADYEIDNPINPKDIGFVLQGSAKVLNGLGYMQPDPAASAGNIVQNNACDKDE